MAGTAQAACTGRACASARLWERGEEKRTLASDVGALSRCKIRLALNNTKAALFSNREEYGAPS